MVYPSSYSALFTGGLLLATSVLQTLGFDNSRSDNLAIYYGQNSYGATHSDTSGWQKTISTYCQDDTINAIPLAFLNVFFSTGGLPEINMANTCNGNDQGVFAGTSLPNCQFLAAGIKACQARGKIVTISLGGATGAASFSSDAQAQTFADTVWNLFLGGSSSTRPFGDAVLDGIDLDIEGGSSAGYAAFVTRIRSHASGASKKYYVTAAPQCPFPDAWLGAVLNAVAFDAVYVQYNNYCGVNNYNNPNDWNFGTWDNWAKTTSPNKNVKIYIGAPAAPSAANSGYVDAATLGNIAKQTRAQYSSFGGIMLWDVSQAYANGRFDVAIKNAMGAGSGTTIITTPTSTPTSMPTTTPTTSTTKGTGSCSSVGAWVSNVAYVGGSQVTYAGHLWTAKWWTQADTPGGAAGVWTDNGACFSVATASVKGPATVKPLPVTSAQRPLSTAASSPSAKATGTAPKASSVPTPAPVKKASTTLSGPATEGNDRVRGSRFFRSVQ